MSVVAVLNQGGVPLQSASRFLDDRAQLNGMVIIGGRIVVDAVIHGFDDPMCCPNFPVVQTLQAAGRPVDPEAVRFRDSGRGRTVDHHHRPVGGRIGERIGAVDGNGDHIPV